MQLNMPGKKSCNALLMSALFMVIVIEIQIHSLLGKPKNAPSLVAVMGKLARSSEKFS